MKAASDAVYLMDKKGTIFESNVAACKMLGKPMEKIINSNIVNIDQNYPLDKFLIFWENLKFNNPVIFETTHTHVNGSQIPVEISSVKFKLEGQTMFYGIARDIRKRVDTLKKLKTSEERFKLAIEGAKDGLWDWNLITSEAYHSDRFAEMLGYEPEELDYTEKAWSDLLHPDDRKMAFKAVEDYLQQKVPEYKSTFRMRCKDGYYRWITGRGKALWNKEGKPYRFMGFNTDITSRRNSEKAFIKSQENYHRLFDTQKEGVLFFNENFDVIDANPAALDILGYSKINLSASLWFI